MLMDFITWKSDYSVGNETLDNQHKRIIKLINELYNAYVKKIEFTDSDRMISELSEYTVNHFGEEERLFEQYGYELAEEHKKEHETFVKTLNELIAQNQKSPKILSLKLTSFLQKWLINHILEEDKKYAPMFDK